MVEQTEYKGVEVKDEIGKEILQQQIEQTELEIKQYLDAKEQAEKDLANYEAQVKIHKELREIRRNTYTKAPEHLVWEYEKNPRWWELQREALAYADRAEDYKDKGTIERYKLQIESAQRGYDVNVEKLAKLKEE